MSTTPNAPDTRGGSAPATRDGQRNPKGRATLIVAVVVAVYALLFLFLNRQTVTVHFVVFTTRLALIWALALATGSGVVIGLLVARRRGRAAS
jgi:uncharacterized integral membrane protein